MGIQYFTYNEEFELENGARLNQLTIAYHTFGQRREGNVVWVCHALTANSDVADWWPHTVEKGRFLDPTLYFTVCANIIGSHYGTTGPLSLNPTTGEPYYDDFPQVSVRDMARVNLLLADHLGITSMEAIIGSSIGGFQALEMALHAPSLSKRLVLIATSAQTSPWVIALNESQRMAIHADATYTQKKPEAARAGMAAARSIALLSYRGPAAYNKTQPNEPFPQTPFRAATYQQYQGEKLCRRFNAYSYVRISEALDGHNVGRGRGGVAAALGSIRCKSLLIGISSDILFPLNDLHDLHQQIPLAEMKIIESDFGHDGFLVEHDLLNTIINPFLLSI